MTRIRHLLVFGVQTSAIRTAHDLCLRCRSNRACSSALNDPGQSGLALMLPNKAQLGAL